MNFCDACESLLSPANEGERCVDCGGTLTERKPPGVDETDDGGPTTDLERLPTTDSGSVRKRNATRWLDSLDEPSPTGLRRAVVPRPQGFSGSTYAADVSNVRVTGDGQLRAVPRGGRAERVVPRGDGGYRRVSEGRWS